jgi:tRNA1Val (adenine37-N6)-methyltransferase
MSSSKSPDISLRPDETIDAFMNGRLRLIQSRHGYRFSIDAIFLSDFVSVREEEVVVDLGTGCGIIPLILLTKRTLNIAFGLEIQEELAAQAARNACLNGVEARMKVVMGDLKHLPLQEGSADVVICNPPYRKIASGRVNPDLRRAIARHEILASLDDILGAAKTLLRPKGRFATIYPCARLADILWRLSRFDLEAKRLRIIYPSLQSQAKLVLIEACRGGQRGLVIEPPLVGQGDEALLSPA